MGISVGGHGGSKPADPSALAEALGAAPPPGAAALDQRMLDDLVALIDEERRRRAREAVDGINAAGRKLPWPLRKVVERALAG